MQLGGAHATTSPDGNLLGVVCEVGGLKIYDVASSTLVTTIPETSDVKMLTFSADNSRVSTWAPLGFRSFDSRTGKQTSRMDVRKPAANDPSVPGPRWSIRGPVEDVPEPPTMSPLGRYAATITQGRLTVFDLLESLEVPVLVPFEPTAVAFSADERLIGVEQPLQRRRHRSHRRCQAPQACVCSAASGGPVHRSRPTRPPAPPHRQERQSGSVSGRLRRLIRIVSAKLTTGVSRCYGLMRIRFLPKAPGHSNSTALRVNERNLLRLTMDGCWSGILQKSALSCLRAGTLLRRRKKATSPCPRRSCRR